MLLKLTLTAYVLYIYDFNMYLFSSNFISVCGVFIRITYYITHGKVTSCTRSITVYYYIITTLQAYLSGNVRILKTLTKPKARNLMCIRVYSYLQYVVYAKLLRTVSHHKKSMIYDSRNLSCITRCTSVTHETKYVYMYIFINSYHFPPEQRV
jgi:hypothetical protein